MTLTFLQLYIIELWLSLGCKKKNGWKPVPPNAVRVGTSSTLACWSMRFWKHHAVFLENWPESLTEGLDSIRNVCVLCQAMPYGSRQCEYFVEPAGLWTIARPLGHIVPPRRSMQGQRPTKPTFDCYKKNYSYCGGEGYTADEMWLIFSRLFWHEVTNQRPRWGTNYQFVPHTVPGFAFLCRRRRWRGPGGNSGLKEGHRGAVRHRDGVNSLDHHLHVLPHGASLAQPLNSFQKRMAVSCPKTWAAKTALTIRDNLKAIKMRQVDKHFMSMMYAPPPLTGC